MGLVCDGHLPPGVQGQGQGSPSPASLFELLWVPEHAGGPDPVVDQSVPCHPYVCLAKCPLCARFKLFVPLLLRRQTHTQTSPHAGSELAEKLGGLGLRLGDVAPSLPKRAVLKDMQGFAREQVEEAGHCR